MAARFSALSFLNLKPTEKERAAGRSGGTWRSSEGSRGFPWAGGRRDSCRCPEKMENYMVLLRSGALVHKDLRMRQVHGHPRGRTLATDSLGFIKAAHIPCDVETESYWMSGDTEGLDVDDASHEHSGLKTRDVCGFFVLQASWKPALQPKLSFHPKRKKEPQ